MGSHFDLSDKVAIVTGEGRGIGREIALGLAEPEEVVPAVLFLCSEGADYITGETIYVDGGSLANY